MITNIRLYKAMIKGMIFIILIVSVAKMQAQDARFSQWDASPVILNPALTGMSEEGGLRVNSQYRSQWGSMAPNFSTISLSADKMINNQWGGGLYLLNDDGVKAFNTFNFALSGSYQITSPAQKNMKLSVGIQAGFIYKKIKEDPLVFDNQYENGIFNTDIASGEPIERYSKLMPEVNIGVYYEGRLKEGKYKPYGSLSILHCTYPKESFLENGNSRLPLHFILAGGTRIELNSKMNLDPKFLLMKQGTSTEMNLSLFYNYNYTTDLSFSGGFGYRFKDAVILYLGCRYKNITYRMSYDINVSPLKTYTRGRGGLEFSVQFMLAGYRKGSLPRYSE